MLAPSGEVRCESIRCFAPVLFGGRTQVDCSSTPKDSRWRRAAASIFICGEGFPAIGRRWGFLDTRSPSGTSTGENFADLTYEIGPEG